ncbi:MAG: hypothetical protein WAL50_06945 [Kineosporiaceae bacterium]
MSLEAMDRLARFDGTAFRPVGPGEIDAPFVHVFAHGWQPGYRVRERLLATVDRVAALPAWDPRLVDATGRALISDYTPLLEALAGLGADHAVLWYSWLDESATDADVFQAFRSRQATQVNGRRLAVVVQRALTRQPSGRRARVHLIGHSHGSAVVTHAAVSMARPPEQVTLLDAPEDPISRVGGASDLIAVVLPRLRPGRGPGSTFVDSYASAFGRPYHRRPGLSAVVDVQLGAPLVLSLDPVRAINAAHLYPVDWYARSVREAARPQGRGVGYGWSPLRGVDTRPLHSWYHAPLPQRPLHLRHHAGEPLGRWRSRFERRSPPVRRPVPGVRLDLDAAASSSAAIVTTVPGDQLVEFDLQLRGCAGGEQLEVGLDGVAAFTALASHPVPSQGRYLMLADSVTGEHLVTARLTGAEDRARVSVVNLRLVSAPHSGARFTLGRSAATVFAAGAVTGSVSTLLTLLVTGLTARRVWEILRRRGAVSREPGVG